jgi:diguanylate cyclase (GGDEF)-like protein
MIILFSSLITLSFSALQLEIDYRREVDAISTRLDQIETTYSASLAGSLWNLDKAQLRLELAGMMRLPDMQALEVDEVDTGDAPPTTIALGQHRDAATVSRDIPLRWTIDDMPRVIGNLHAEITLEGIYRQIGDMAVVILVSQGIQIFLVSTFILIITHRLVTRHLFAIADHVGDYDVRRPWAPLQLRRTMPKIGDELDQVVTAINRMSGGLRQAYAELRDANAQLQRDISVRRTYEEQLVRQANYDDLTGLPNRLMLLDRLDQVIATGERDGGITALLCIDLDRFKNINDTLGHAAGDALLKEASQRLASCLREHDILARMGGDEFIILLPRIADDGAAQKVATRIVDAFGDAFVIGGKEHFVTASIGITLHPTDGAGSQQLLRNADLAMYMAKDQGRNGFRFFTEEINQRVQERLGIEARLHGALTRGEFVLNYQPIFDLESDRPCMLEALLRWRQPDGTIFMPGQFIAIAEDTGLIRSIGEWAVATACAELRELLKSGSSVRRLAVNISAHQLREAGFAGHIERILAENGLPPDCLELELTESVLVDQSPATELNLTQLADLGVRLSIDDFGTGYSSLAYLHRYPFDTLKIDRSFIAAADHANTPRLIETIVTLAHGLDMEVIAEGVEKEEQLQLIRDRHCRFAQGYLFSRPLPLGALMQRLAAWEEEVAGSERDGVKSNRPDR